MDGPPHHWGLNRRKGKEGDFSLFSCLPDWVGVTPSTSLALLPTDCTAVALLGLQLADSRVRDFSQSL